MDRFWLLTSTFYGNWLPGDPRGFVSRVRDQRPEDSQANPAQASPVASAPGVVTTPGADATGLAPTSRREHDVPRTCYDADMPGLRNAARQQLRTPPVRLDAEQAKVLLAQFQETARYRGWQLIAVAVMSNHVHLVVGVQGDPAPAKILGDFKAYGSRALNLRWQRPAGVPWWTVNGSTRRLPDPTAALAATAYVRDQDNSLIVWIDPEWAAKLAPAES